MPEVSSVHFDVALTNVSVAYRNMQYIARDISPEVAVRRQSDRFFIYDPERSALRPRSDLRAPGTAADEVDFTLSSDTYYCEGHALAASIPDEERDNSDLPLKPEIDRVEYLSDRLLLAQEIALAQLLRDPASTPNYSGADEATKWGHSSFDAAARIETARAAIIERAQVVPNVLVLSQPVFAALRNADKVTDRVKYTKLGIVGAEELAALFDVERVIVGRAVVVEDVSGTPTQRYVWGKDAMLMHVPSRAGLKTLSPTITFRWATAAGSLGGWSVDTWREERRKATSIRVQKYYDHKLIAGGAYYLFTGCVN